MLTGGIRPNDTYKKFASDGVVNGMVGHLVDLFTTSAGDRLVPPHKIVKGIDKRASMIVCKMLEQNPNSRYGPCRERQCREVAPNKEAGSAAQTSAALTDFMYRQGKGPKKESLRDYMRIRMNPHDMPPAGVGNIRFLRRHFFDSFPWVFKKYELTKYARKMLEQGKNPARY